MALSGGVTFAGGPASSPVSLSLHGGSRMALVRMLIQLSGTRDGAEWPAAGALLECPAEEAAQLVDSALAVAFTAAAVPVVESAAIVPAVETATAPRSRQRKS